MVVLQTFVEFLTPMGMLEPCIGAISPCVTGIELLVSPNTTLARNTSPESSTVRAMYRRYPCNMGKQADPLSFSTYSSARSLAVNLEISGPRVWLRRENIYAWESGLDNKDWTKFGWTTWTWDHIQPNGQENRTIASMQLQWLAIAIPTVYTIVTYNQHKQLCLPGNSCPNNTVN
jgi:hypothetical protein